MCLFLCLLILHTCFIFLFNAVISAVVENDISNPGEIAYTNVTSSAWAASIKCFIFAKRKMRNETYVPNKSSRKI